MGPHPLLQTKTVGFGHDNRQPGIGASRAPHQTPPGWPSLPSKKSCLPLSCPTEYFPIMLPACYVCTNSTIPPIHQALCPVVSVAFIRAESRFWRPGGNNFTIRLPFMEISTQGPLDAFYQLLYRLVSICHGLRGAHRHPELKGHVGTLTRDVR